MRILVLALCLVVLQACPALCHPHTATPLCQSRPTPARNTVLLYYDDMSSGGPGWTHGETPEAGEPRFHVDGHNAHPSGSYSYWCGALDPSYSGGDGYGNGWDERLLLPAIPIGTTAVEEVSWGALKATYLEPPPVVHPRPDRTVSPVLTFSYRHDSEPGYDVTRGEIDSFGTWVSLTPGYSGPSGGWQDVGAYGFELLGYSDPVEIRFRFLSDGSGSDENGLYDSDGGAFHVDNVRVYDALTGETLFFDDCEDGIGLCTPQPRPGGGDWWHIIEQPCFSWEPPPDAYSWWCGDDADTGRIPPNLENWLMTPLVDVSSVYTCTLGFALHAEVPPAEGDYWIEEHSVDDGETWVQSGVWWGDFGECDCWCEHGILGIDMLSPSWIADVAARWTFVTDEDGSGPGARGGAGIAISEVWFYGEPYHRPGEVPDPITSIKRLFR